MAKFDEMAEEIDLDKAFICSICGKESRTGHFKWRMCHNCYLNKMREVDAKTSK